MCCLHAALHVIFATTTRLYASFDVSRLPPGGAVRSARGRAAAGAVAFFGERRRGDGAAARALALTAAPAAAARALAFGDDAWSLFAATRRDDGDVRPAPGAEPTIVDDAPRALAAAPEPALAAARALALGDEMPLLCAEPRRGDAVVAPSALRGDAPIALAVAPAHAHGAAALGDDAPRALGDDALRALGDDAPRALATVPEGALAAARALALGDETPLPLAATRRDCSVTVLSALGSDVLFALAAAPALGDDTPTALGDDAPSALAAAPSAPSAPSALCARASEVIV